MQPNNPDQPQVPEGSRASTPVESQPSQSLQQPIAQPPQPSLNNLVQQPPNDMPQKKGGSKIIRYGGGVIVFLWALYLIGTPLNMVLNNAKVPSNYVRTTATLSQPTACENPDLQFKDKYGDVQTIYNVTMPGGPAIRGRYGNGCQTYTKGATYPIAYNPLEPNVNVKVDPAAASSKGIAWLVGDAAVIVVIMGAIVFFKHSKKKSPQPQL